MKTGLFLCGMSGLSVGLLFGALCNLRGAELLGVGLFGAIVAVLFFALVAGGSRKIN